MNNNIDRTKMSLLEIGIVKHPKPRKNSVKASALGSIFSNILRHHPSEQTALCRRAEHPVIF